jgi:hypothetical protein
MKIVEKDKIYILRHSARVLLSNRQYERDFIIRELAKLSIVMGTDKDNVGDQVSQVIDYVEATKERIAQDKAKEAERQRMENSIPSDVMLDISDLVDDTLKL